MTSRQSAYDKRRLAEGWRRVPVWLDPTTSSVVDALMIRWKCSAQEAIRRAIEVCT